MIKRMMITGIILLFFVCSWMISHEAGAETKNGISAYLVELGVSEYEEGKVREAIKEFRKALVADPYNAEAQDYLRQLGVHYTIEPGRRTSLMNGSAMEKHIYTYAQKVAQLEQHKKDIEGRLSQLRRESLFRDAVQSVPGPVDDQYYTGSFQQYKEHLNGPRQSFLIYREEAPDVYAHQDKMIQVYEDYVTIREGQIEEQRDALLDRELDIVWAGNILVDKMDALSKDAQVHNDWVAHFDDTGYVTEHKDRYVQHLKGRLDMAESDILDLEVNLYQSQDKISALLDEREEFLSALRMDVQ